MGTSKPLKVIYKIRERYKDLKVCERFLKDLREIHTYIKYTENVHTYVKNME